MKAIDPIAELKRVSAAAGSQRQWALSHGISPAYVTDVLQLRRVPGPRMLDALGLELVVTYRRKPREA